MNNQIKNILFYGVFGTFGAYTFYQVSQSEFQRKMKSQYYFDNMINSYRELEACNFICANKNHNNYEIKDITKKEEILKSIEPVNIVYGEYCKNEYDNFRNAYNKYKLHKYDVCYKFAL